MGDFQLQFSLTTFQYWWDSQKAHPGMDESTCLDSLSACICTTRDEPHRSVYFTPSPRSDDPEMAHISYETYPYFVNPQITVNPAILQADVPTVWAGSLKISRWILKRLLHSDGRAGSCSHPPPNFGVALPQMYFTAQPRYTHNNHGKRICWLVVSCLLWICHYCLFIGA